MSEIVAHLQQDLRELQKLLTEYVNPAHILTEEELNLLNEKNIYIENTYTLEELQAEGLENIEIINCLEAVGIFLGYSDLVRKNTPAALDHFMMALHYNPYSEDALCSLLEVFMDNMEEENKGQKVYELLSQMYDFSKDEDREVVTKCALQVNFVQLYNEITIQEAEK